MFEEKKLHENIYLKLRVKKLLTRMLKGITNRSAATYYYYIPNQLYFFLPNEEDSRKWFTIFSTICTSTAILT